MNNLKDLLISEFGLSGKKKVETLDKTNLFIKSGITTIAALAGEGKTTFMNKKKEEWTLDGYMVSYVNFDSAPTYGSEMIECPENSYEVKTMLNIIKEKATQNDVVIIDSLKSMVSYYGLDVLSNSEMYPLMLDLREIVKKTGCSIVLVHHVYRAKNIKSNIDSLYGSRAIEEQSDSAFIYCQTSVKIVKNRCGFQRDESLKL